MKTIEINSLSQLSDAAELLIQELKPGCVVAIYGAMGAGKTTLISEVARLMGVKDSVSSPTFALVNEYLAGDKTPIYHFDFYRINRLDEVYDMGYEEYFYGEGICFIEWAELVKDLLPDDAISVKIDILSEDARRFTIS
ncbi:MAG: tRNA (adenosine(37)-N6)-threonylcarbamoyltransferase complex ATPase subunit type 1 TsaE [Rikenellaceae bacterium]